MAGALGGPAAGTATVRQDFTEPQRARWVALATRAADEAKLPADPEFRAALASYLDWTSRTRRRTGAFLGLEPDRPARRNARRDQPGGGGGQLARPDETVSFEAHVKPLFRERDRKSMTFAFDLFSTMTSRRTRPASSAASATGPCPATAPGRPRR